MAPEQTLQERSVLLPRQGAPAAGDASDERLKWLVYLRGPSRGDVQLGATSRGLPRPYLGAALRRQEAALVYAPLISDRQCGRDGRVVQEEEMRWHHLLVIMTARKSAGKKREMNFRA
jgi:hypothetical protein